MSAAEHGQGDQHPPKSAAGCEECAANRRRLAKLGAEITGLQAWADRWSTHQESQQKRLDFVEFLGLITLAGLCLYAWTDPTGRVSRE